VTDDRRTDHATEKRVAVVGIACSGSDSAQNTALSVFSERVTCFWWCPGAVSGCSDYEAPPGGLATRTRDLVTVECSATGAQWELRCELGRWVGPTYNCSDVEWTQAWTIGRLLSNSAHFSKGQFLHLLSYTYCRCCFSRPYLRSGRAYGTVVVCLPVRPSVTDVLWLNDTS